MWYLVPARCVLAEPIECIYQKKQNNLAEGCCSTAVHFKCSDSSVTLEACLRLTHSHTAEATLESPCNIFNWFYVAALMQIMNWESGRGGLIAVLIPIPHWVVLEGWRAKDGSLLLLLLQHTVHCTRNRGNSEIAITGFISARIVSADGWKHRVEGIFLAPCLSSPHPSAAASPSLSLPLSLAPSLSRTHARTRGVFVPVFCIHLLPLRRRPRQPLLFLSRRLFASISAG